MQNLTKIYFIPVLIGLIFWTSGLMAQDKSSVEEQRIYYLTYESCRDYAKEETIPGMIRSGLNPQGIEVLLSTYGDLNYAMDRFLAGDGNAFAVVETNKGLGTYLKTLLNSAAFTTALQDCFPAEAMRRSYVVDLLVLDASAKFLLTAPSVLGYLRYLKWTSLMFHKTWVKLLFLGHVGGLLTASTVQNQQKTTTELMKEQFQSLSQQIDQLSKRTTPSKP